MDGIVPLDEVDTLLSTWASVLDDGEPPGLVPDDEEDEVLHAAIARTVKARRKDTGTGKCRVSGVPDQKRGGTGSVLGNPKAKNSSRKEVTHLELRQYRLQFEDAKRNKHKPWVGNDVYDLNRY